jgi:hypothetical protein
MDDRVEHITHLQFTPEHAWAVLEFTNSDLHNPFSLLVNGKIIGTKGLGGSRHDDDVETLLKTNSRGRTQSIQRRGKDCVERKLYCGCSSCEKDKLCAAMYFEPMT